MRKVVLIVLVLIVAASMAMAQYNPPTPIGPANSPLAGGTARVQNPGVTKAVPTDYAGQTTDVLGAHNVYGRGCVACHAPHGGSLGNNQGKPAAGNLIGSSTGNQGLWGANWGTLPATTLKFGDWGAYDVTMPTAWAYPYQIYSNPTGIMLCLSCHDGSVATNSMMTGQTFESLPVAGGKAPTLLGTDGYNNDHPVGPKAAFACGGTYDWDGCDIDTATGEVTPTGAAFITFVQNYGFTPELYATSYQDPSNTLVNDKNGVAPGGSGYIPTYLQVKTAAVSCTTCHNQHSMNVYVGTIAGKTGAFPTQFFIRGYYNPVNGSNSVAQFCRQCHGGESNEMHGQYNVPTI